MGAMTVTTDSKSFLPRQIPEGGRLASDLAGSTPTPTILASPSELDNFQARVGLRDLHNKFICSYVIFIDVSASPAAWQLPTQNSITG